MSIDYKRMTYQELADILGITAEGAASLARAHKWPRYVSYDGKARVSVPVETLTRRKNAHKTAAAPPPIDERKAERLAARKAADEARKEQVKQFYRDHAAALTHPESAWRQEGFEF